jgi:hypothetical protein
MALSLRLLNDALGTADRSCFCRLTTEQPSAVSAVPASKCGKKLFQMGYIPRRANEYNRGSLSARSALRGPHDPTIRAGGAVAPGVAALTGFVPVGRT